VIFFLVLKVLPDYNSARSSADASALSIGPISVICSSRGGFFAPLSQAKEAISAQQFSSQPNKEKPQARVPVPKMKK
jgi:hypothetical protein